MHEMKCRRAAVAGGNPASRRSVASSGSGDVEHKAASGMVLPFDPLALSFHDLNYYVPLPSVSVFLSAQ